MKNTVYININQWCPEAVMPGESLRTLDAPLVFLFGGKMLEVISNFDYHSKKQFLSVSGLKNFAKSPEYYKYKRDNPGDPTDAMKKGTALHTAVLEPKLLCKEIVAEPKIDKRSAAGKEASKAFYEKNSHKTIISAKDYAEIIFMREKVYEHKAAKRLLALAEHKEISIMIENHPEYAIGMKCRPDMLCPKINACVDVKSTKDASYDVFKWDIRNYKYYWQAAYYLDCLQIQFPGIYDSFIFIAVENSPPFGVAVYELHRKNIDLALSQIWPLLEQYKECVDTDVWPGYDENIQDIMF